jgi:HD-GYP domain-containing protein (c-di-GMP phosphodiesterase class II)/HAMP domain-containing protein
MPASEKRLPIIKTLRFQLLAVIAVLLAGSLGSLAFSLHALDQRKHDYLILNLTGQMRVAMRTMAEQARHYLGDAPDDYDKYNRDLQLYWRDLQKQLELVDRIIVSLKERRLEPELTGRHEAITCTWDESSRHQLTLTADDWTGFRKGLSQALGDSPAEPRLTWAAQFIAGQGEAMARSSDKLANAFQGMMEEKLDRIRLFQMASGVLTALLLLVVAIAAHYRVLRPLHQTVKGFGRVAQGDFGHQVPVFSDNEIGRMTQAFNHLSERLNALFKLTDRINQGRQLDETLEFIRQEFRTFLPVDWVGVLFAGDDPRGLSLERMAGDAACLREGDLFPASSNVLAQVRESGHPVTVGDLEAFAAGQSTAVLAARLAASGYRAAVFLPLSGEREGGGIMVFAAREVDAYTGEHLEFLANIAGQVGHILGKTVVMEGLVVAAVEGLAKLAESRDPETGDHLVRMALYSAIVAEELGREGPYRDQISPAYVRDVLRFAPMHDIGKVGIRDDILLKPGRLTPEERSEMERHPGIGGEVLRRCEAQMNTLGHSIFSVGIEIAECHHEKFDGSGYPAGLAGEAIPLSARIVAVADVFDALTSKRPYKEAWPVDKALAVMEESVGFQFDPVVLASLKRAMPQVLEVYQRLKHV